MSEVIIKAIDLGTQDGRVTAIVTGETNAESALAAWVLAAPASLGANIQKSTRVTEVGPGVWEAEAAYAQPEAAGVQVGGELGFEFDTSGGTLHVTHALSVTDSEKISADGVPDFKGAINVSSDGIVQGVDVTFPQFSFSVTKAFALASFTPTLIKNIFSLTGKTNNASVSLTINGASLTFSAGELLFLGARGSKRDATSAEISYSFSASPNGTWTVDGATINVSGHDVAWAYYRPVADDAASAIAAQPAAIYAAKVYASGDFTSLGI